MSQPTDEDVAAELAATLMRHTKDCGPLTAVRRLTRLLRILRLAARIVTAERDRHAYAMGAVWSHRAAADLVGVTRSTMQQWMEAGRNSAQNANSNGDE